MFLIYKFLKCHIKKDNSYFSPLLSGLVIKYPLKTKKSPKITKNYSISKGSLSPFLSSTSYSVSYSTLYHRRRPPFCESRSSSSPLPIYLLYILLNNCLLIPCALKNSPTNLYFVCFLHFINSCSDIKCFHLLL